MKSLIEDLVSAALEENQRAVDQALRGHRTGERTGEDGALWDTCFSHVFIDVLKEHGAYVPDQCGHVWNDEDGAKRICTELRGHTGEHASPVSEPDAADLELGQQLFQVAEVQREVERLSAEVSVVAEWGAGLIGLLRGVLGGLPRVMEEEHDQRDLALDRLEHHKADRELVRDLVAHLPDCDRKDCGRPATRHTGGPEGDDFCDEHAAEWSRLRQSELPSDADETERYYTETHDQNYGPQLRAMLESMKGW